MERRIELRKCYRIAGRTPIVVTKIYYDSRSKRIGVAGYTRDRFKDYAKFYMYDMKTHRTIAELEKIDKPAITEFRFNSKSKITELPFNNPFKAGSRTVEELKEFLAKPRVDRWQP